MPWTSAAGRAYGHATTYSTSFGPSTTYVPRSTARESSITNGYSHRQTTSGSRPLPIGPGPLDSTGKRLRDYSVGLTSETRRNNHTPNGISSLRNGPLKANHTSSFAASSAIAVGKNTTSDYSRHTTTNYGTTSRRSPISSNSPVTNTVLDGSTIGSRTAGRPRSGSIRGSRSSSLIDLSQLNIDGSSSRNQRGTNGVLNLGGSSKNNSYLDRNNNDDALRYKDHHHHTTTSSSRYDDAFSERSTRPSGYTPSMSREASPVNTYSLSRRVVERGDSPPKSSPSNQSSSSSMSNGVSSKYRDGGKVGLKNLGNTCFMNSVLQCLSNTRVLLEWCLDEHYHLDINTTTSNMKGALIKAYANLMQSLWKEKNNMYVSPNMFKTQIQKFAPRFMGYAQQDCQEFLRYLLEGLHEDVNRVVRKPAPIILDDDALEKKSDLGKSQDYWKAYLNRDNSQIVDIFVGQLKSELKFTSCGHRSVTFDPFWDLSLPIPKNRHEVNIEDCIRLFMKEEELAAEERPNCAKCKERRSCLKMFSIQKFPKILVLHLKRFSQERFGRKLNTLVDFPVTGLDLTEYSAEGRSGGQRVLYDLYAVSNHSGGTSSGHYTAYCQNPYTLEWLYFNDSRVTGTRSNQVISSEAYVLFYELSGQGGKSKS